MNFGAVITILLFAKAIVYTLPSICEKIPQSAEKLFYPHATNVKFSLVILVATFNLIFQLSRIRQSVPQFFGHIGKSLVSRHAHRLFVVAHGVFDISSVRALAQNYADGRIFVRIFNAAIKSSATG